MTGQSHPGTIATMFQHNLWANVALFAQCAKLSDAQLDSRFSGVYGTIRDTCQHIAYAEQSYLHRITTGQPLHRSQHAPPPTLAELQESIRATGDGFVAVAPQVKAEAMVTVDWDGTPRQVPVPIILTQVINHATEHRAQIMTMLTQLGIEPDELSGWSFFDEQSG